MSRKKSSYNKAEWLFGTVFVIVGLPFLIIGIVTAYNNISFRINALETTAVISAIETSRNSDGDTTHTAYVKYRIDGIQYEERLDYYSSGMHEGEEILIYYHPEQPERITSKSLTPVFFYSIFFLIGLVFVFVGFVFILSKVKRARTRKYLIENGRLVYAEITGVNYNNRISVNGRNPYIINCKWVDPSTGLLYFFTSENIWFDPKPILSERDIKDIAVYIDAENPKNYAVSTEVLENMVANL